MQPIRFKLPVIIFINLALVLALIQPAVAIDRATIYYVRQGFSGNCLDWSTACDLQSALGLANDGDQVRVAAGTYYPTSTTDRGISFQMESGVSIFGGFPAAGGEWETRDWTANVTTLSANIGDPDLAIDNSYHVVMNNNVSNKAMLDGFVLTGGYATREIDYDWHGAGMLNINSSPTLIRLLITANEVTDGSGGGMYNYQSSPSLAWVTISDNEANSGGGMYSEECSGTLSVSNSTFSGNQAHFQGGGMQNEGCTVTLSNVTFSNNDAFDSLANGGGMANYYNSNVTLSLVTFIENTATYYGGGMFNNDSTINVSSSSFTDNSAELGGGIYNYEGTLSMTGSTLTGNHASVYGGGVYAQSNTPTLSDVNFVNNTSDDRGGGFMGFNSSSTLNRINFQGNTANGYGGGAYLEGGISTFTDVNFISNSTPNSSGGGLFNYGSSPSLTNVTFYDNEAEDGGGLANYVDSQPQLRNVTFSANTAVDGAAIYNYQSILEIYSATLTLNVASGLGGGIYSTRSSEVPCETTMINGIVWGNSPEANQIYNTTGCYSVITYSNIEGGYTAFDSNIDSNPMLMPLADNGGFTKTHALSFGSPTVDSGSPFTGYLPTDQRGFTRPFDGTGDGTAITDMGAYEYGFLVHLPLVFR